LERNSKKQFLSLPKRHLVFTPKLHLAPPLPKNSNIFNLSYKDDILGKLPRFNNAENTAICYETIKLFVNNVSKFSPKKVL
jgi:hypothetical protein